MVRSIQSLVPALLLAALSLPAPSWSAPRVQPQSLQIALDAGDAFERGMGAWGAAWSRERQGVVLKDGLLVEDDGPGVRGYNRNAWYKLTPSESTTLEGEVRVKKILRVPRPGALAARLFLSSYSSAGRAVVTFNGTRLDGEGTWRMVPPALVRAGDNEVVLAPNKGDEVVLWSRRADILANAPDRAGRPARSFRSADGGRSWQPIEGEYRVRLHLTQYPEQGYFISPALYLGEASGKAGALVDSLASCSAALRAELETPPGTRVSLEARTGSTPVYEAASWSEWRPARGALAVPKGHRYLQWKAVLGSRDPTTTPLLKRVTVTATSTLAPRPAWSGELSVAGFRNEEIRYTSMPFAYEDLDHPKLKALREKYHLAEVVQGAASELEAFVKLRHWVSRQWRYDPPVESYPAWDADEILQGKKGFCVQYAIVYAQCCLALGYQARFFYGYHPGGPGSGHEVNEVWSNELGKWVMMDANANLHHCDAKTFEPLSMAEIQERMIPAMYGDREVRPGNIAPEPREAPDMLTCRRDSLKPDVPAPGARPKEWPRWYKWLQVRYIPRNNWYAEPRPLPYEQGHTWDWSDYWAWEHPRVPRMYQYHHSTGRHADLYWTLNQVCFEAERAAEPGVLNVRMGTVTPSFETFLVRLDGGDWRPAGAAYSWKLHPGTNRLEMRVRNKAGVMGPVSHLAVAWGDTP